MSKILDGSVTESFEDKFIGLSAEDPMGWAIDEFADLSLYDRIRRGHPMQRAFDDLKLRGWFRGGVSGLRAIQPEFRKRLQRLNVLDHGTAFVRFSIGTAATSNTTYETTICHSILFSPQGCTTVGDARSSRPLSDLDDTDRDTRFPWKKQACGSMRSKAVGNNHLRH